MVKHNQTILRQQPMNCSGMFDHVVVLAPSKNEKLQKYRIILSQYTNYLHK